MARYTALSVQIIVVLSIEVRPIVVRGTRSGEGREVLHGMPSAKSLKRAISLTTWAFLVSISVFCQLSISDSRGCFAVNVSALKPSAFPRCILLQPWRSSDRLLILLFGIRRRHVASSIRGCSRCAWDTAGEIHMYTSHMLKY